MYFINIMSKQFRLFKEKSIEIKHCYSFSYIAYRFLGKIKTSIKVNGSEEDDSILDFFFPNFVLTLRDVTLDIKTKDDDAFLEEKLSLSGDTKFTKEALEEYNLPRQLIRRYFKNRKCFRFRKPIKRDKLQKMLTLDESELKQEFRRTLDEFRNYIFSCKPKLLKSGKTINGRSKFKFSLYKKTLLSKRIHLNSHSSF